MIRHALLVSSACLLTCGPSPPPVATVPRPTTTTAVQPIASIGPKSAYATPPQQTAPWTAPKTSLDARAVSAAEKLFEQGLGDPRGCTYREIEIALGDVWNGGGEPKKTHGWVFADGAFAVAWNGLVYRPKSIGPLADLRADVQALLDADDAARKKWAHDNPGSTFHRFPTTHEGFFVATDTVSSLKPMLLLRLGEGDLAKRVWDKLDLREDAEPYQAVADDWLWSLYDRGVNAHMRGDVELALESFRNLPSLAKLAQAECAARGVKARGNGSYFSYLDGIDDTLAEEQRRASLHDAKMDDAAIAALAKQPQNERIAKLVGALDQVAARQWGQPGGVVLGEDPIVKALIAEGEPAVEPLLDAFENDTRLTRSVQFWRDFARHRSIIAVYEAAYVALSGILDASFFEAVSTGDHLTARGVEGRRVVGKKIREHWAKWKGVPMEERLYRELADDAAGADMWLTAATKITQPSNVQIIPSSSVFQSSIQTPLAPGQKPTLRGESLRAKTSPSVSSLLATRLASMPDARHACSMANAFAAWDAKAALPHLARLERDTIGSYRSTNDKSFAGSCIAQLTTERADAGDASALAEYGAWIAKTTPKDADWSLEPWFAPMVAHPTAAPIVAASNVLFRAPSPWVPFVSDGASYTLADILKLDLFKLPAFRAHVAAELGDKKKIGAIVIKGNSVELKTSSYSSSQGMDDKDPLKPAEGTTMDLRVCDEYAAHLTASQPANAPAFRIYWPQAERDRAIAQVALWVKTR